MLGHHDKGHLVDEAHYKRVYRQAGWLSPVVLVQGCVAGLWSQQRRGSRLTVTVEPFGPFSRPIRQAIEAEVAELGRFLGLCSQAVFV